MKIIITRPEEDAGPLAHKLHAMGHDTFTMPMMSIVARKNIKIPNSNYQMICLTSANGYSCCGRWASIFASSGSCGLQ
jgi:uroporphyrinogen-III synthase